MKVLVLAAGQGKRLRPLTNDIPKCMVSYKNKPIIDYIINTSKNFGINDIAVVCGYKKYVLKNYLKESDLIFFSNDEYDSTNMVSTLFEAKEYMDDDLIVSYSDIVYKDGVLKKLIDSNQEIAIIVDRKWRELWAKRMENPLDDAETLKIKNGRIIELGKKPKNFHEIEGQYIGLIKFSKSIINNVIEFYEKFDKKVLYDGLDYKNMYLTSFIQMMINNSFQVSPVFIDGGWVEIDTPEDLNLEMI